MNSQYQILRKPYITEKTVIMKDMENKVVFRVPKKANKIEITNAIQSIFSVKVEKIQTLNVKGKVKRQGKFVGKRADWKKAVVTLKEGDKIEYFEGA